MRFLWLAMSGGAANGDAVLASNAGMLVKEEQSDLSHRGQIIQLYLDLRTSIYGYLVCLGLTPQAAEDVIQEAFLRLHRELQSGTAIADARSWLFRVARNLSFNHERDERRLVPETFTGEQQEWLRHYAGGPNPEELYLAKEQMMRLDAGLSLLTPQQRECIHLRAEGLRYREIAQVLGVSIASVGELIQRALARLTGEMHG